MRLCAKVFETTTNATAGAAPRATFSPREQKTCRSVALPDWQFPIRADDIVEGVILAVSKTNATVKIADYEATLTPPDIAWTNAKSPEEILKPGDVALVPDSLA